jgi:diaminohydroxyphosphoribosylaminopyrimidine deaminase/5-amino-6-(5-phosphoribosylamino)uracil reductase
VTDAEGLAYALGEARRALGRTSPRPAVGALLRIPDGRRIPGHTQGTTGPHAETHALAAAGDARGATLYVTLEPCCHHGRTPPCTDAIIAAGVSRVVVGLVDPYPAVNGGGIARLRAAGIHVDVANDSACIQHHRGFSRAVTLGLPEVTLKVACSVDGSIATASGASKWITGPAAREAGHRLRATHDAVVVGIGTVLADDPALTVRLPDEPSAAQPIPIVLDTHLRIPADARVLAHPRGAVILCGEAAPAREVRADVIRVPSGIEAAARAIVTRGLHRVLVEGGPTLWAAFLAAGLVDRLETFVAPSLIPGGRRWLPGPAVDSLEQAIRLGPPEIRSEGVDQAIAYELVRSGGS